MLGKAVAWGESRGEAIDRLHHALAQFELVGVQTNCALLMSVLSNSVFRAGAVTTNFLGSQRSALEFGDAPPGQDDFLAAAVWQATRCVAVNALWLDTSGWRLGTLPVTVWRFEGGIVTLEMTGENSFLGGAASGDSYPVLVLERQSDLLVLEIAGRRFSYRVVEREGRIDLLSSARQVTVATVHTEDALLAGDTLDLGSLKTPLPGTVVAVHVAVGDRVARGAALVTVEAMKMEHTLTAPRDGVVSRVVYDVKERVAAGAVLIELSAPP